MKPNVVSREDWLRARADLLIKEKEHTQARAALADARLIAVSRAPLDEIEAQRKKYGWDFTWVSSYSSDFNVDYFASSNDLSDGASTAVGAETVHFDRGENHGVNVFCRNDDGDVFHTYSAFNRGIEELNGAFGYFDMLPKGRAW